MYDILKMTIQAGNFKFSELQVRLKRLYAMGDITEEQLAELLTLAIEKTNPEIERPETLILIQGLYGKLEALSSQVKDLRAHVTALESGNFEGGTDGGSTGEYPDWEPWDGLSNQYQPGAIVNHNDQLWQSVYNGQNVWEPGVVDERFWVKYLVEA